MPARRRGVGFVFQHYAAFKHMTVRDNVAFGLKVRTPPSGRDPRPRRRAAGARAPRGLRATATRPSSRAASASGWRWPARSPSSREVLLLDEPFGALDAQVRAELRAWLRRLHDEVHVTTIFVTHDQEEAMDVAEQIVVMNHAPRRAGRHAARRLRAPGQRVRDALRRARSPSSATGWCARTTSRSPRPGRRRHSEAMVERVVHLGFEVRVELTLGLGPAHVGRS